VLRDVIYDWMLKLGFMGVYLRFWGCGVLGFGVVFGLGIGMGFALSLGGMTARMVKLFGDIVAMENENGKLVVMKGEERLSLYEYEEVRELTTRCWALYRVGTLKCDLVFADGKMQFGYMFVYPLPKKGGRRRKQRLLGVHFPNGTGVIDDSGNFWAFIPERHPIVVVRDRFFVVHPCSCSSYVRVYSPYGDLLAEGDLSGALSEACQRAKVMYGWHDICNVSR
jgi:hypothetical protein